MCAMCECDACVDTLNHCLENSTKLYQMVLCRLDIQTRSLQLVCYHHSSDVIQTSQTKNVGTPATMKVPHSILKPDPPE